MSSYKERLLQTPVEQDAAFLENKIAQGQNTLEKGLLEINSKIFDQRANLLTAENSLRVAEQGLETAKSSYPLNVNAILSAKNDMEDAIQRIEEEKDKLAQIEGYLSFLQSVKEELFS